MSYSGTNTIHATFNWNPAYDAYKHVALWGNDATGDGTKKYPYKTVAKALSTSAPYNVVLGAGVYREVTISNPGSQQTVFVADGNVIIDVQNNSWLANIAIMNLTGIYFRGSGNFIATAGSDYNVTATYCTFDNCHWANKYYGQLTNCTFINTPNIQTSLNGYFGNFIYCTIYNSYLRLITRQANFFTKCIFKDSTIQWDADGVSSAWAGFTYNNLYNVSMKFVGATAFKTYSDINTLKTDLIALGTTYYPTTVVNNLYFIDPLFNKQAIGDVSLAITSPCKNMAYDGTLIGNGSIGISLTGSTNPATSAFDNSNAVNITIDATTGALTMTDTSQNSQITTKPIANLQGRNIFSLSTFGFYSDRNGEYIDATPDLDLTGLYSAGDTLITDHIYIVDGSGGQVTYNSSNYAVGDRFVCRSTATTFTNTSVTAYVREIIEGPTRNNIEARFSNGTGNFKNTGDTLTTGYWYYLSAGTATLSGISYTAGQFIKGDGTAVTSSAATIEEVFTIDIYQYYETFGLLSCNRSGNVFTGAITKGNGDPSFDRTTSNVFKIASKYIQIRYTIQANNLTP